MSFAVLLISLLFAAIETLVSWLLLAFEPISHLMNNVSSIVTTGAIFGIGMALTFAIIFIVGSMHVSKNAAAFVQEHAGRTMALGALSIVAVLIVSIIGEMIYQAQPLPPRNKIRETDICYVLDFSDSMNNWVKWDTEVNPDYEVNSARYLRIDIAPTSKPANGKNYEAGEVISYNITVKNISGDKVNNIIVTAYEGGKEWRIDSLEKGDSRSFSADYRITAETLKYDIWFTVDATYDWNAASKFAGQRSHDSSSYVFWLHREENNSQELIHNEESRTYSTNVVTRADNLKAAFADIVGQMNEQQRVSVITYRSEPTLLADWCDITPENQKRIIRTVNGLDCKDPTNFANALAMADQQVEKALQDRRRVAVIMISDGEDRRFKSTADCAPIIMDEGVRVHTVLIDSSEGVTSMRKIATETGGHFNTTTADLEAITQTVLDALNEIRAEENANQIPDTLITERYVSRKTIINARVLRILILFLLGFFFKIIAVICIGNNQRSIAPHMVKAILIGAFTALWVEFGYAWGLPLLLVIAVYWTLLMGQIVTVHD